MTNEKCRVVSHREIGSGYRYIEFEAPTIAASATPGQFVHVRVPALEKSALRRPFSIFNAEDGRLELLYKTVGRGTAALNEVKPGDEVEVMGPLGHGFPLKCAGEALLVGGGYGVAPLYFLSRRLLSSLSQSVNPSISQSVNPPLPQVHLFVGGRTKNDLLALDRFEARIRCARRSRSGQRERARRDGFRWTGTWSAASALATPASRRRCAATRAAASKARSSPPKTSSGSEKAGIAPRR